MTDLSRRQLAWQHLFSAYCDGNISPEELAELDRLLRDHPEARRCYLQYLDQQAGICRLLRTGIDGSQAPSMLGATAAKPKPAPIAPPVRRHAASFLWRQLNQITAFSLFTAATVLFCGATILAVWQLPLGDKSPAGPGAAAVPTPSLRSSAFSDSAPHVARVGRTFAAIGPKGPSDLVRSHFLNAGQELELLGGRAEVVFASGAVAVVEGPAQLRIEDENRCSLLQGKLSARISASAGAGFTVQTPNVTVTDLGTEFALEVDAQGLTTVSVAEGRVAVEGPSVERTVLAMGQIVAIDAAGRMRMLPTPFAPHGETRTTAMMSYRPQIRAKSRSDFVGVVGHLIEVGEQPLRVTHLGAQDVDNLNDQLDRDSADDLAGFADDDGFVRSPIQVGLWSEDGGRLLASAEVHTSDPLIGSWRYAALPGDGVTLEAGGRYLIGALVGEGIEWFLDGGVQPVKSELPFQTQRQIKLLASRYHAGAFGPPLSRGFGAPERWAPANAAFQIITDHDRP